LTGGIRWCRATPRTVVEAGISISGRVRPETEVAEEDLVDFMIEWPAPGEALGARKRK
jgi:hypothetical protein